MQDDEKEHEPMALRKGSKHESAVLAAAMALRKPVPDVTPALAYFAERFTVLLREKAVAMNVPPHLRSRMKVEIIEKAGNFEATVVDYEPETQEIKRRGGRAVSLQQMIDVLQTNIVNKADHTKRVGYYTGMQEVREIEAAFAAAQAPSNKGVVGK